MTLREFKDNVTRGRIPAIAKWWRVGIKELSYAFKLFMYDGKPYISAGCRFLNLRDAYYHWWSTRGTTAMGLDTLRILDEAWSAWEKEVRKEEKAGRLIFICTAVYAAAITGVAILLAAHK